MSHRSTKSKGRNRELDALVSLEAIDATRGKEIRRFLFAAQDLEQHRDGGRLEGHPVYSERPSGLLMLVKRDSNYGSGPSLTNPIARLMLMSAPLGFGRPGYIARLGDQNNDLYLTRTYHWCGPEWLDETLSVSCSVIQDKDTHVKVGLNKGRYTDWNLGRRVDLGVCVWSTIVMKNGQIEEASESTIRGQRADPCSH